MVQNKIIQVDVAFLTYNPRKCADAPSVKQDSSCVVGLEELRKHREMKRREKNDMGECVLQSALFGCHNKSAYACRFRGISPLQMV
jgi:hypothetical protein